MCYLVRQQQPEAEAGSARPPAGVELRPRWTGAIAVAVLGGVALAATFVEPSPARHPVQARQEAAPLPTPLAAGLDTVSTTSGAQRSLPADDGVPTSTDVVKAGLGHCEHGL